MKNNTNSIFYKKIPIGNGRIYNKKDELKKIKTWKIDFMYEILEE